MKQTRNIKIIMINNFDPGCGDVCFPQQGCLRTFAEFIFAQYKNKN